MTSNLRREDIKQWVKVFAQRFYEDQAKWMLVYVL